MWTVYTRCVLTGEQLATVVAVVVVWAGGGPSLSHLCQLLIPGQLLHVGGRILGPREPLALLPARYLCAVLVVGVNDHLPVTAYHTILVDGTAGRC